MAYAEMVVFHEAKVGSADHEWEDGAGWDAGDPAVDRDARCIVVDGATEAYDSIRWVGQLVRSFLGVDPVGDGPALTRDGMDAWFGRMQDCWRASAPTTFGSIFEERKFHQDGSFATLLGCQISGLGAGRPSWLAVAIGDTVHFHVRGTELVSQFPALRADDFGLDPDGVSTQPSTRDKMRTKLAFGSGELAVGDRLYLATDALANWMVRAAEADGSWLWQTLDGLHDPATFRRTIADRRRSGEMKNDDVTLMRVEITGSEPDYLVVCK